jgi:NhaP-type Na+/H+ and K+/H+ antiporter
LHTLLISTTFLLVLAAAFSLGILTGYAAISAILQLITRSARPSGPATAVLNVIDAN